MEIVVHALNQAKMRINSAEGPDELIKINNELQNLKIFLDFFQPEQDILTSEVNNLSEGLSIVIKNKKEKTSDWDFIKEKGKNINLTINKETIKNFFQEEKIIENNDLPQQPPSMKKTKLDNTLSSFKNKVNNTNSINGNNFMNANANSNINNNSNENNYNQVFQKNYGFSSYKQKNNNNNQIFNQESKENGTSASEMFISARDQLMINAKKQGNINKYDNFNDERGNRQYKESKNKQTYLTEYIGDDGDEDKKNRLNSTVNKKFQPPYKKQDLPKSNTNPNSKLKDPEGKLKNVDSKMIELIESEILDNTPKISWNEIAGLEAPKNKIIEMIVWPFSNPEIFTGIRAPPRGLLLFGPPGTGKTMIGKAIASDTNFTFFSISASSLTSKWVGEGEKMVKTLFSLAGMYQPSVVFIDEVDSLLCARTENENESSRRIKTEFLCQMDGANTNPNERILLIGATNRPQELDDAALRRFVKKLYIPLPNGTGRREFIVNLIEKEKEAGNKYEMDEKEIQTIVERTKGYSGADLRNLCAEASLNPIRTVTDITKLNKENLRATNFNDFIHALSQVKPTVSQKDLKNYIEWNRSYGTVQFDEMELEN